MAEPISLDDFLAECRKAIDTQDGASHSLSLRADIVTRVLDDQAPDFRRQWLLLEEHVGRQMSQPHEYPAALEAGQPFEPFATGDTRAGLVHMICAHFNLVYAETAIAS